MFCSSCGKKLDLDARFCPSCGRALNNFMLKKLEEERQNILQDTNDNSAKVTEKVVGNTVLEKNKESLTETEKETIKETEKETIKETEKENARKYASTSFFEKVKAGVIKNRSILAGASVSIGTLVLLLVLISAVSPDKKEAHNGQANDSAIEEGNVSNDSEGEAGVSESGSNQSGESAVGDVTDDDNGPIEYVKHGMNEGNTAGWNIAVKQGEWVYFICYGSIYKQNAKGDTILVFEDAAYRLDPRNLNICGDYLYFICEEVSTYTETIQRVRTDGTGRETIITAEEAGSYSFSFVCDYESNSVIVGSWYYKSGYSENGNKSAVRYMKYSIDSSSVTYECEPDDWGNLPISNVEIIGMDGNYVYAFEQYSSKSGRTNVLAKIDPNTFSVERLELGSDTHGAFAMNNEALFMSDDMGKDTVHMVDLRSMTFTKDVLSTDGNYPMLCYKKNSENSLILSDFWCADIGSFPQNKGYSLGDYDRKYASIIDDEIYFSYEDSDNFNCSIYKLNIPNKSCELVYSSSI